jgi:hypothetical protein
MTSENFISLRAGYEAVGLDSENEADMMREESALANHTAWRKSLKACMAVEHGFKVMDTIFGRGSQLPASDVKIAECRTNCQPKTTP